MSAYKYVKKLEELNINDVELVGGKNASLGEMLQTLSKEGIAGEYLLLIFLRFINYLLLVYPRQLILLNTPV
ncbi:hypothetical protein [Candidatus Neptunichlamydia sp. REUL1]|uniref:hypothetical protein n=1 Tax=Candidatus Neptunichlamydia sp. REUL1 TaxID=3064277 RepID=UPI00292FBAD7|nr:hypothetical protein [Candidatus Neptunochlamydia sp. REUL1]